MYAVIRSGGQQLRVAEGDVVQIEKRAVQTGEAIEFDDVLTVRQDDKTLIGQPGVEGAKVKGTVLRHGRSPKIVVFKFKRRKGYSRKQGHRQDFTEIRIDSIEVGSKKRGQKKKAADEEGAE